MEEVFLVRNVFNETSIRTLASRLSSAWPEFDEAGFCQTVLSRLEPLSFSERNVLIRDTLGRYLPQDYPTALDIILRSLPPELENREITGYEGFNILPLNEFVAQHGLAHYDLSMQALYQLTKRFSAEGAIRPFILQYPEQTLAILATWADDENSHVRRLVSEGTRPRLPWTMQLKPFIEDPRPVLALLEKVKTDPELMVRRSVANNLNDIAKDNPDLAVETLKRWKGFDDEGTQWLIRHAARTLVKQGNKEILEVLGYPSSVDIKVSDITLDKAEVSLGDQLHFVFEIHSASDQPQGLLVDYIVHHVKANGKLTPKVFKLTKKTLKPGETLKLEKTHSFRLISTRKYYPGSHCLEIQINGETYSNIGFELVY